MAARTVRMPAHRTRADTIEATVMTSPAAAREANDTQPTSSANPVCSATIRRTRARPWARLAHTKLSTLERSEEHTSELQSRLHLVCRLLLEKKKTSSYAPSRLLILDVA